MCLKYIMSDTDTQHIQNCHLLATIYLQQSMTANREEEIHFIVARVLKVLCHTSMAVTSYL